MNAVAGPSELGPYSEAVRRYFANPEHAGDADAAAGNVLVAQASDPGSGTVVRLAVATDGLRISAMRYRVYGCPHVIAALEYCCERFEGSAVKTLAEFSLASMRAALDVPVEKMGRMLLIEDVIRSICEQAERPGQHRNGQ